MDGNKIDYKSSKEAFVSGATGSTVTHVNLISAAALFSIALYAAIRSRFRSCPTNLVLEWTVLVLPLLFSMTLFAEKPLVLCFLLAVPTLVTFRIPRKDDEDPPLSPSVSRVSSLSRLMDNSSTSDTTSDRRIGIVVAPLPALTVYRAHMLLMTILAILAVDFPVFPRSLAKCETFGVSLMDLGVGSFVFSQGVVSAIPLLKDPTYLLAPAMTKIGAVVKKVLPLLVLGVVRVISVKGTEYPEHESEYGSHWNFFFTLAVLPILQVVLHPAIVHLPISFLGFVVALSHQLALSLTPLQRYTLNAPRTNLISANKEGLVSLSGYLAIHLLGLSVGTLLLPPSPSDFRRQQNRLRLRLRGDDSDSVPSSPTRTMMTTGSRHVTPKRQDDKTAIELFSYAFLWWSCLGLCFWMGVGGGISRRLANLPYVIWVAAYNTSFIMFYLLLDKLSPAPSSTSSLSPVSPTGLHPPSYDAGNTHMMKAKTRAPPLLEAINLNGLALFLLANVVTGLINLSMSTMYARDTVAMVVLCVYSFGLSAVAWICRERRVWKL